MKSIETNQFIDADEYFMLLTRTKMQELINSLNITKDDDVFLALYLGDGTLLTGYSVTPNTGSSEDYKSIAQMALENETLSVEVYHFIPTSRPLIEETTRYAELKGFINDSFAALTDYVIVRDTCSFSFYDQMI